MSKRDPGADSSDTMKMVRLPCATEHSQKKEKEMEPHLGNKLNMKRKEWKAFLCQCSPAGQVNPILERIRDIEDHSVIALTSSVEHDCYAA